MLTEQFEMESLLGSGSYGEVYKAVHKQTGRICAIKVLPSETGQDSYDRITKEINIMVQCNNPSIVKCFGSEINEQGICLFLEYCAGGSVKDILRSSPGLKLTEEHIASILQATLQGLEYLHQCKIIHRDIKAGNILVNEQGDIKLSDFGVSAELMHTFADKDTLIGSPFWMSPQVLSKNKYNCKTDIWSLGITAIELAEGQPPYSHIHPIRAMFAIQNNPPQSLSEPHKWSKQFNDFVRKCLSYEPLQRPSARELLNDPFMLKSKGECILQDLVTSSIEGLQRNRKKGTNSNQLISKNQINFNSDEWGTQGEIITNGSGTMIEHHGKVDQYQPFWQGREQEERQQYQDTMVVKDDNKTQEKEADFVAYYRNQKGDSDQRNSPKKRKTAPDHEQIRCSPTRDSISSCEGADQQLKRLTAQMNKEIQQIKEKYRPQIERLRQKTEELSHKQSTKLHIKSRKQEEKNSFAKIKSILDCAHNNSSASRGSGLNPPQRKQQEHQYMEKSSVCNKPTINPALQHSQLPPSKKSRLHHQTQTFEQALNQLKQAKKVQPQDDGSYFTSFLKKIKKNGLKQNNNAQQNEQFSRTTKIDFNKTVDKNYGQLKVNFRK